MVVTLDNVSFKYVDKYQLRNVNFSFTDSDKIGVIGVNGCGKSTMLKIIMDQEKPKEGKIVKSGNMVISYLEQDPIFNKDVKIIDTFNELSTKEHPINEYEVKTILIKLKLNFDDLTNTLSGGQKKRLALGHVLVKYCDILILDEPTNHLDNDMILWLEKYLMKWNKGLLMVTHDRYFLERVCNKMVELDNGNLYEYNANYSRFLELKEERLLNQAHQMQKINSILRHEYEWVKRGAQARTTKSKSRLERFYKMSEIKFSEAKEFEFNSVKSYLGKNIIEIKDGCKAFPNKKIFEDFNLLLLRSDRIGIVGENGCGKSTLFKIIMGLESLDSGQLILGETLRCGYLQQELDTMDNEQRVIDYIRNEAELIQTIDGTIDSKTLLENFLFDSSLQYTKIKSLSGGEKRRLQIVKVLMKNPNLLILDEPTNDLDIYTLEILENYLDSFFGPVLVVSHDRYFLDKVCDKILYYDNGNINSFMGSFSSYLELPKEKQEIKKETVKRVKNTMSSKDKNELFALTNEIPQLEDKIKQLNDEYIKYETNYEKLMEITKEKEELDEILNEKMERYFYLEELKESFK